jgi:hypothetical protein
LINPGILRERWIILSRHEIHPMSNFRLFQLTLYNMSRVTRLSSIVLPHVVGPLSRHLPLVGVRSNVVLPKTGSYREQRWWIILPPFSALLRLSRSTTVPSIGRRFRGAKLVQEAPRPPITSSDCPRSRMYNEILACQR